jgi:hypothetical protein
MRFWNDSSYNVWRWLGLTGLVVAILGAAADLRAETVDTGSAPASFAELLAGFKGTTGLEARFEEEKYLALLAVPLRSSGRLYFEPPSTLLRRVEEPRPQDVLVANHHVRISDGEGVQTIDLASRAEVRPLVESMIWIFTGDLESLETTYRVDYQRFDPAVGEDKGQGDRNGDAIGAGERWEVRLVPRDAPLSQLVSELRVSGRGREADTMELTETSGDRTLTRIIEPNPQRQFDSTERRELFGFEATSR